MNEHAGAAEARGLYTAPELASYLRASVPIGQWSPTSQRLHAWVRADVLAHSQQHVEGHDRLLSFEDLLSSQAVSLLRKSGCTLEDVRKAERFFAHLYGVRRPFASRPFWTGEGDIIGRLGQLLVVGNRGGQIMFDFVLHWLTPVRVRIGFDDQTGQAVNWQPDDRIELDPSVQFGSPCVVSTSVPTSALWSYVRGGDSVDFVARSYGLTVADVEHAVAWEDRRRRPVAADARVPA